MLLSGSFAELRSNHFHSGIDIKTQGVTGLPVYAVADGYVSRVSVSPTGYGNALYINHPNGTTSVYGHLERFAPAIQEYVKDHQYQKKSFKINLKIPSSLFPVKKGDEVARSGNTGGSGGPHLHFEIRDTRTEEPMNPLQYGFAIEDNISPKIFSLLVVPLSDTAFVNSKQTPKSYPVVFYDGKYHLKNNPAVPVRGKVGFAIQTNDYLNGTYNKCGINRLCLNIDGETQFAFRLNRFAFRNTRYINSHIVYAEYACSKRRYIKTWIDPGNRLPIYTYNFSQGMLNVADKSHKVEIEVADSYGNKSVLEFNTQPILKKLSLLVKNKNSKKMYYDRENLYTTENCRLRIPKGALYANFNFLYAAQAADSNYFSNLQLVHNKTVPLHIAAVLDVKAKNLPTALQSKAVLVNVNLENGTAVSAGGRYADGWVEAKIRKLGAYAVAVDTIPPQVDALSIAGNKLTETNRIRFKITDDLSGIKSIEGLIDGKWTLFDYDPKNSRITHYFDKKRFVFGKRHAFKLTVTDWKNNSTTYECSFWK